jgi:hypothetical protein
MSDDMRQRFVFEKLYALDIKDFDIFHAQLCNK